MSKYLCNGIELPELPEWDKEQYPYAVIQWCDHELSYTEGDVLEPYYARLTVSDQPLFAAVGDVNAMLCAKNPVTYMQSQTKTAENSDTYGADVWGDFENSNVDTTSDLAEIGSDVYQVEYIYYTKKVVFNTHRYEYEVIWANHDIYNIDGSLYFEANDTEPVTPVNPYLPINGAWVKHDIYKQVGNTWVKQPQGAVEVEDGAWSALS